MRRRAAENTVYFASVNCASEGVPITSAIAAPDGRLICFQRHDVPGLLVADLSAAMGLGRAMHNVGVGGFRKGVPSPQPLSHEGRGA